MSKSDPADSETIAIRRSEDARKIADEAFVLTALRVPYRIEREGDERRIEVRTGDRDFANEQLELYSRESANWPPPRPEPRRDSVPTMTLIAFNLFMLMAFGLQARLDRGGLVEAAGASVDIFRQGEWWRAFSALFLHADEAHLFGNLLAGSFFLALLVPRLGQWGTWLGIALAGFGGNALNALLYDRVGRLSIGFSTAVFGALGIWTGFELMSRSLSFSGVALWRRILVPVGAGVFILAFWGSSEESDYMAHFWGFLVGGVYGFLAGIWNRYRGPARAVDVASGKV